MEFRGKTAVVTGASSGIGQATAIKLGEGGARVVVHYHRNQEGARESVSRIEAAGSQAVAVPADLSSSSGVGGLRQSTHDAFGPIDILINNAGDMIQRCLLRDMDEELFDAVMDLNVKSLFLTTKAFLKDMMDKKGGTIVNMASVAGRNGGGKGAGVYASSKAASLCLTKAMAKEFIEYGIRVNAVNPGVILTPFHDRYTSPELLQTFVEMIPAGYAGRCEDVAEVIVFLASDRSRYVIGETIEINGGMLMD